MLRASFLLLLVSLLITVSSCQIEKRRYMPGYSWSVKHKKPAVKKESNPSNELSYKNDNKEYLPEGTVNSETAEDYAEAGKSVPSMTRNNLKSTLPVIGQKAQTPHLSEKRAVKKPVKKFNVFKSKSNDSINVWALLSFAIGILCLVYLVYFSVFIFIASLVAEVLEMGLGLYTFQGLAALSLLPPVAGLIFGIIGSNSKSSDSSKTFAAVGIAFCIIVLIFLVLELALMALVLGLI